MAAARLDFVRLLLYIYSTNTDLSKPVDELCVINQRREYLRDDLATTVQKFNNCNTNTLQRIRTTTTQLRAKHENVVLLSAMTPWKSTVPVWFQVLPRVSYTSQRRKLSAGKIRDRSRAQLKAASSYSKRLHQRLFSCLRNRHSFSTASPTDSNLMSAAREYHLDELYQAVFSISEKVED